MLRRLLLLIGATAALGLASNYRASAQSDQPAASSSPASNEAIRSITVITLHAKIAEVDRSQKLVKLEGPQGAKVTIKVENPLNLEAAKIGEPVVARYYEVVTVRKKKAGETVPIASLQGGISTAKPGGVPGAVAEQKGSLLVTVQAIDETKGTVTVKAADGTVETVKARDPGNLKQLKVGDELVVTLARALAISLEKEPTS